MAKIKEKKGIAMAVALTFMAALMISGVPQMNSAITNTKSAHRMLYTEKAFWLAEAGIHEARYAVANGTLDTDARWTKVGNVYSLNGVDGDDSYTVSVTKTGDDYDIDASGTVAGFGVTNAYGKDLNLDATVTTSGGTAVFNYAAHSYGDITVLNGTVIKGNVAASGTVNIPVTGTIQGDMTAAGGLNMGAWASGGVTGGQSTDYDEPVVDQVEVPEDFPTPSGPLSNTSWGTVVTIGPGKLAYTSMTANFGGEIHLKNNTEVFVDGDLNVQNGVLKVISGKATIYLSGNIVTTNDGALNSNADAQLFIFGVGDGDETYEIKGNSSASNVAIFSPNADVTVTNSGGVEGSVVAKSISVSGAGGIEYDSNFSGTTVGSGTGTTTAVTFDNWRES